MINLNNPVTFTKSEQSIIDSVLASGKSGPDMWKDNSVKDIKHKISVHTIEEQECRCAFCEALLVQGSTAIEHIAPKGLHRLFTFKPLNLVSACGRCNSTRIKGEKETMKLPEVANYESNVFNIVHPRLDNPDNEIVFTDASRTIFDKPNCSKKGIFTIDFFCWDDEDAVFTRQLNANRAGIPNNIKQYALLVSTYK